MRERQIRSGLPSADAPASAPSGAGAALRALGSSRAQARPPPPSWGEGDRGCSSPWHRRDSGCPAGTRFLLTPTLAFWLWPLQYSRRWVGVGSRFLLVQGSKAALKPCPSALQMANVAARPAVLPGPCTNPDLNVPPKFLAGRRAGAEWRRQRLVLMSPEDTGVSCGSFQEGAGPGSSGFKRSRAYQTRQ